MHANFDKIISNGQAYFARPCLTSNEKTKKASFQNSRSDANVPRAHHTHIWLKPDEWNYSSLCCGYMRIRIICQTSIPAEKKKKETTLSELVLLRGASFLVLVACNISYSFSFIPPCHPTNTFRRGKWNGGKMATPFSMKKKAS